MSLFLLFLFNVDARLREFALWRPEPFGFVETYGDWLKAWERTR